MISKWDNRLLELAKFISNWSKDPSTRVGAVITDSDNRVMSVGYNGFPKYVEDLVERYEEREIKYKLIVHGERNALLFAGRPVTGCTLYTYPFMPCAPCAGTVIQAGITKVVAPKNDKPHWQADFDLTRMMFKEASVELIEVEDWQ